MIQLRRRSGFNPITTVAAIRSSPPARSGHVIGGRGFAEVVSSRPRPKKVNWTTLSVKAAATRTPTAAVAAQAGEACQAPMRIDNSAGKPLKPGNPIEARSEEQTSALQSLRQLV